MASDGTTSVVLGAHTDDTPYPVNHTHTGTIHVRLTPGTDMVFYNAFELRHLGETLITAADEVDSRQATLADAHHTMSASEPVPADHPSNDDADKAIIKGYSY